MSPKTEAPNRIFKKYDEIPIPVLALDKKSTVVYFNSKAEQTLDSIEAKKTVINTSNHKTSSETFITNYNEQKILLKLMESFDNKSQKKSNKKSNLVNIYMVLFDDELNHVIENSTVISEKNEFLQNILDCIYDQIYVMDNTGKVIMINEAVINKDFYREDIVGKTMHELIKSGFCDDALCYDILENKASKGKIFKEDQKYDLLSWGVPHFDENGEIDFIVCTEWDLENLTYLKNLLTDKNHKDNAIPPELQYYRRRLSSNDEIICNSEKMKDVLQMAGKLSRSDSTILIYGESGTGKELLTKYIYNNSQRASGPLIEVNCGAMPENLIESELFGYEKGAFTDADTKGKKGLFEAAHNGTLLLDEVGEIPFSAQAKLLRALQEKEILRVGGHVALPVDVRVIAATNVNLMDAVEEKKFREDLYYRLNVLPIQIPPLRERIEDIPGLVDYFIDKLNTKYKTAATYNPDDLDLFYNYQWPGNVRELRNIVERAILVSNENVVPRLVWANLLMNSENINEGIISETKINFKTEVEEYEKNLLIKYMPIYENSRQFADFLGVDKSTVNRKLQKYGIK